MYGGRGVMHTGFWWGNLRLKRPLGRSRCRLDDNIKMDLQGVDWGCMDWTDLAQDRDRCRELLSVVMNLQVP